MSPVLHRIYQKASVLVLFTILLGVELAVAHPGFLFQDEVTKEIIIDVHREHQSAKNPFDDLVGKFKPDSAEYKALLSAAGLAAGLKADENVEVKSLKSLRLKFDEEFAKVTNELANTPVAAASAEQDAIPAQLSPVRLAVSAKFSDVADSGFSDPKLGDYRLIPLDRGLMMVGKSGEKRVFSSRDVLKDDVFKAAIGESGSGDRVLAILHQAKEGKYTVWVMSLTGDKAENARVGWQKALEFNHESRSVASVNEVSSGAAINSAAEASTDTLLTLDGATIAIAIGNQTKFLELKTGESVLPKAGP
jgi:hypothetical protein